MATVALVIASVAILSLFIYMVKEFGAGTSKKAQH